MPNAPVPGNTAFEFTSSRMMKNPVVPAVRIPSPVY